MKYDRNRIMLFAVIVSENSLRLSHHNFDEKLNLISAYFCRCTVDERGRHRAASTRQTFGVHVVAQCQSGAWQTRREIMHQHSKFVSFVCLCCAAEIFKRFFDVNVSRPQLSFLVSAADLVKATESKRKTLADFALLIMCRERANQLTRNRRLPCRSSLVKCAIEWKMKNVRCHWSKIAPFQMQIK